jgi:hypothetical protein
VRGLVAERRVQPVGERWLVDVERQGQVQTRRVSSSSIVHAAGASRSARTTTRSTITSAVSQIAACWSWRCGSCGVSGRRSCLPSARSNAVSRLGSPGRAPDYAAALERVQVGEAARAVAGVLGVVHELDHAASGRPAGEHGVRDVRRPLRAGRWHLPSGNEFNGAVPSREPRSRRRRRAGRSRAARLRCAVRPRRRRSAAR